MSVRRAKCGSAEALFKKIRVYTEQLSERGKRVGNSERAWSQSLRVRRAKKRKRYKVRKYLCSFYLIFIQFPSKLSLTLKVLKLD